MKKSTFSYSHPLIKLSLGVIFIQAQKDTYEDFKSPSELNILQEEVSGCVWKRQRQMLCFKNWLPSPSPSSPSYSPCIPPSFLVHLGTILFSPIIQPPFPEAVVKLSGDHL